MDFISCINASSLLLYNSISDESADLSDSKCGHCGRSGDSGAGTCEPHRLQTKQGSVLLLRTPSFSQNITTTMTLNRIVDVQMLFCSFSCLLK